MTPVDGVVLAAGRSTRMDKSKALLEIGAETFLERAIHVLREGGCRHVVAVLNDLDDWPHRLADAVGAAVVVNPDADSQQLDSLRLGLAVLPADWGALAVLPVDVPLVSAATVRALVDSHAQRPAAITLPFHNGVAGHPVLIGRQLEPELRAGRFEEGLRSLIMARSGDLCEVKVVDPGTLIDIDTPEDYWRYVKDRIR